MRLGMMVLILLLPGCQGVPVLDRWAEPSPPSVMPLWERYQQCLVVTNPSELLQIVDQLDRVMLTGSEPPAWMKSWGPQIMRQPLRTAIDPQALGIACTMRAATVMAQRDRLPEARALYQRVVSRYPQSEWAYYHEQAIDALTHLPDSSTSVIALRAEAAPSR